MMMGMGDLSTILFSAAVSALVGAASRMIGQPAAASFVICLRHFATSVVGTFVIDWTAIGWGAPNFTVEAFTIFDLLLFIIGYLRCLFLQNS